MQNTQKRFAFLTNLDKILVFDSKAITSQTRTTPGQSDRYESYITSLASVTRMIMIKFTIVDRETNNWVLESYYTREEAEARIEDYEADDKMNENYVHDFYQIIEQDIPYNIDDSFECTFWKNGQENSKKYGGILNLKQIMNAFDGVNPNDMYIDVVDGVGFRINHDSSNYLYTLIS